MNYLSSHTIAMSDPTFHDKLRSTDSTLRSFISFTNASHRRVEIVWINFRTELIPYRVLGPAENVRINTYKSHPWIFRDAETKELMNVNHNEVFWPEPYVPQANRTEVFIHFPIRSLKKIAMCLINAIVKNGVQFESLGIPQSLVADLKLLKENINNIK